MPRAAFSRYLVDFPSLNPEEEKENRGYYNKNEGRHGDFALVQIKGKSRVSLPYSIAYTAYFSLSQHCRMFLDNYVPP